MVVEHANSEIHSPRSQQYHVVQSGDEGRQHNGFKEPQVCGNQLYDGY